jgi:hypothetical protein
MSNNSKPVIELSDVLDWAYCQARVWWRYHGREYVDIAPATGEALVKQIIRRTIHTYYEAARRDTQLNMFQALGLVWKKQLSDWGLSELAETLLRYTSEYKELLKKFGPEGSLKRPDGTLYTQPTWTRAWRDLSESTGLSTLERTINAQQHQAGLRQITAEDRYDRTMGLADVFIRTQEIAGALKLPGKEQVLGVHVPLYVDLFSVRLKTYASLVVDGGVSKLRGRPEEGAERAQRELTFELHLFDDDLPSAASLMWDLRIMALFHALPPEDKYTEGVTRVGVKAVQVRHMLTNKLQTFTPDIGAGLHVLDSMAGAVYRRISRGDFSTARMVHGVAACRGCDYKGLCFTERGLMNMFNPPLQADLALAQNSLGEAERMLKQIPAKYSGKVHDALLSLLPWVAKHADLTNEQLEWILPDLFTRIGIEVAEA